MASVFLILNIDNFFIGYLKSWMTSLVHKPFYIHFFFQQENDTEELSNLFMVKLLVSER